MKKIIYKILLLSLCVSCHSQETRTLHEQNSFCYWRTSFNFYWKDVDSLKALTANHLYVRYFDVDWDPIAKEAKPVATLDVNSDSVPTKVITPCVFFKNRVFENSTKQQLDTLAVRVKERIDGVTEKLLCVSGKPYYNPSEEEIQEMKNRPPYFNSPEILIDCDWTAGTRDNFFYFLNQLKKTAPDKEITVTLRLWQYKDKKTSGVPPVSKVLLMCYNVQSTNNYQVENSIASLTEINKYITGVNYPLQTDIALPAFSWAAIFRNKEFKGVISDFESQYSLDSDHFEQIGKNQIRLAKEVVIGDFFARPGDEIRIEQLSKEELNEIAKAILQTVKTNQYSRITFFSWDSETFKKYGTETFKDIYNRNFY